MILGVILVRLGSRRLAGKALREIKGKPLLWYLYERMTFSKLIDKVVIATADNEANLPIIKFSEENKIGYFAGEEKDLTDRIYKTAKKFCANIIVKIGGDCPLVDPEVIDRLVSFYLENKDKYDYVANNLRSSYPHGLDLEVFPFSTIDRAWNEIKDPFWREWLTIYISEHSESYRLANVENEKDLSNLRWTVDYEEDFLFVRNVFERLYPYKKNFLMNDILELLQKEPWLTEINSKYKDTRIKTYLEEKRGAGK